MRTILIISLLSIGGSISIRAEKPGIAEDTLSPDKTYGITVPSGTEYPERNGNSLVEVSTGKEVAVIQAATAAVQQNHGGYSANWTQDGENLLWSVDGKWFPRALMLIGISETEAVQQLDLLERCQQEILRRVKAESPERYRLTRETETGSAYPDGFTIMLDWSSESLSFPLEIDIELTNDPKGLAETDPEFAARLLQATLQAEVKEDFSPEFSKFELVD